MVANLCPGHVELGNKKNKLFYLYGELFHKFFMWPDVVKNYYGITDFYHLGDEGDLVWSDPEFRI